MACLTTVNTEVELLSMLMLPRCDLSAAVPDWFQNAGDEIGGAAETDEETALAIPITTVAIICALTLTSSMD